MKLSIVMPVYNEFDTLQLIVDQVLSVPYELELIIVDDGSTDGTRDLLPALEERDAIRVFLQPKNQGKGAAVRAPRCASRCRSPPSPCRARSARPRRRSLRHKT